MEKKYKISVVTPNNKILTYFVDSYKVLDGGLIQFIDKKFNKTKIFDSRLCEIEVFEND